MGNVPPEDPPNREVPPNFPTRQLFSILLWKEHKSVTEAINLIFLFKHNC